MHTLPRDVRALLQSVDGIHLWADLDQGRAYFGIAPLDEWQDAAGSDGPALFHEPPAGMLVISYHQNGDYAVLDTATSIYRWFDHEDIGNPVVIGVSVEELLDWYWTKAAELRPAVAAG